VHTLILGSFELSIEDKNIPLKSYYYSHIKNRLQTTDRQKVSLNTIIHRTKKHGFYLKKPKRTSHDREVLTRYVGELIQHDASFHLWAPDIFRVGIVSLSEWSSNAHKNEFILSRSCLFSLWSQWEIPGVLYIETIGIINNYFL